MGTRGLFGFVADGREALQYNQYGSYPEGLGVDVLRWLRKRIEDDPARLKDDVRRLRVVDPDSTPTPEDVERLARYANTSVSGRDPSAEWYVLLRNTQGDPEATLEAGVIEDASSFAQDSLFCEWGYVIDLDGDGAFEVYRGFQREPHDAGRFAARVMEDERERNLAGGPYYPVRLMLRWPLGDLPDDETFVAETDRADDD